MKIKICGIRRTQDCEYINEFLPDYCGFILSDGFGRSVSEDNFNALCKLIDKQIEKVGVFVDEDIKKICRLADRLDIIQLHGNENLEYITALKKCTDCEIWKAVRAKSMGDIEAADKLGCTLLIDSFVKNSIGGTGKTADFDTICKSKFQKPFILAGGLNCDNIQASINAVSSHNPKPFCVDISSGVETDKYKDREKIKNIIELVRGGK